jgi:4-aminobutyrate aminotransferase-like enzyme
MSLLQHAPAFSSADAVRLARDLFGIEGTASPLTSERDQNFRIDAADAAFVLKIANATETRAMLEAQNAAMEHVASRLSFCPRVVRSPGGEAIARHGTHFVRLVTWLPGVTMGSLPHHASGLLADLGRRVGELDAALETFDRPALHRAFHWDLAGAPAVIHEHLPLVDDRELRHLVETVATRIVRHSEPGFAALPRSAIHNDANDFNVLVDGDPHGADRRVSGIVDFGDMVHGYTVADLAVAIAYAVLGKRDPLRAAATIVRGYHAARPLDDREIASLLPLVQLRLCLSVALAAHQRRQRPDDAYLAVSQAPIRRCLPVLADTNASVAEAAFRAACGRAEALARRRATVGRNLSVAYQDPIRIVRGAMQYLYDDAGRKYLDAYNNVPHVGHGHPRVVEAVARQLRTLNTNTRYLNDLLAEYAERLAATMPEPLRVCYFVNSGSEANELALRLARAHTRRRDLMVLDAAYHGNTTTLIEISPYKFNGPGGEGRPSWVHVLPLPDVYRGLYREDARAGERYAASAGEVLDTLARSGRGLCGFIAETCPSVGGQIVPPPGYLRHVYEQVRAAGGVCIADEVQTAYGRMGTSFYAFEDQQVVPDIVVLGKPIGNGYPLGAVVTTAAIAASFDTGMEFFSTFGGSTASCAAGLAVLDVVHHERLQAHAHDVGAHLLARLRDLPARHAIVGDVRGSGLFLGVELVRDRTTLEPASAEAALVVNRLRDEGILIGTDGPFHNVLKIRPPMPFDRGDADALAVALDGALGEPLM